MGLFVFKMSDASMGASRHKTKIVMICDGGSDCESLVWDGRSGLELACVCLSEYSVFSTKVRF